MVRHEQTARGQAMTVESIVGESSGSTAGGLADNALKAAAALWFLVAFVGQVFFAAHILIFYGATASAGNFEAWNKRLIHGILEGDPIGNLAVAVHLALALVITIGGPLQLIPQIRNRAPTFHHWNGRIYIFTALLISLVGLYMVWTRGVLGGFPNHLAISINAFLIIVFAVIAVRHAIARDIDTHRRWALRLFLAVSGVWFIRIGYMSWLIANQAPVGMAKTLDGPFDHFVAFASYLLPLAVLELYFRAQEGRAAGKLAMATVLVVLAAVTAVGVFGTVAIMWRKDLLMLLPS